MCFHLRLISYLNGTLLTHIMFDWVRFCMRRTSASREHVGGQSWDRFVIFNNLASSALGSSVTFICPIDLTLKWALVLWKESFGQGKFAGCILNNTRRSKLVMNLRDNFRLYFFVSRRWSAFSALFFGICPNYVNTFDQYLCLFKLFNVLNGHVLLLHLLQCLYKVRLLLFCETQLVSSFL